MDVLKNQVMSRPNEILRRLALLLLGRGFHGHLKNWTNIKMALPALDAGEETYQPEKVRQ